MNVTLWRVNESSYIVIRLINCWEVRKLGRLGIAKKGVIFFVEEYEGLEGVEPIQKFDSLEGFISFCASVGISVLSLQNYLALDVLPEGEMNVYTGDEN